MSLINVVYDSTHQMLPQTPLPPILSGAFGVFHWVHRSWHWHRRGKTYLNPNNFLKLTTGHALNFLIGNNRFVRLAAQCVLVSNCIQECVEQQAALGKAYKKWFEAIQGSYPLTISHKWDPQPIASLMSPSSSHRLYVTLFDTEQYIRRVAFRTAVLAKRFFTTSMASIDAVDAFSLNPDSDQAVNEFFVNGNRCLDAIAENREELVAKLRRNQRVIDSILKRIGSPCQTNQFIEFVDKTVGRTQMASNLIAKVNKAVGVTLTETLKYLFFGVMSTIGLSSAVPDSFVPCRGVFEETRSGDEIFGRFAGFRRRDRLKHPPSPLKVVVKTVPVNKPITSLREAYEIALLEQSK